MRVRRMDGYFSLPEIHVSYRLRYKRGSTKSPKAQPSMVGKRLTGVYWTRPSIYTNKGNRCLVAFLARRIEWTITKQTSLSFTLFKSWSSQVATLLSVYILNQTYCCLGPCQVYAGFSEERCSKNCWAIRLNYIVAV